MIDKLWVKKFPIKDRKTYLNLSWVDLQEEGIYIKRHREFPWGCGSKQLSNDAVSYSGFSVSWLSGNIFFDDCSDQWSL